MYLLFPSRIIGQIISFFVSVKTLIATKKIKQLFLFCKLYLCIYIFFLVERRVETCNAHAQQKEQDRKTATLLFPHMPETNRPGEKRETFFFSRHSMREKHIMGVLYAEVQEGRGEKDHGKEEEGKSAKSLCVRFVKEEEEEEKMGL